MVGAAVVAERPEEVVLQQIVDRHCPLVLDLGTAADDRAVVQRDVGQPFGRRHFLLGVVGHARWPCFGVRKAPGWPPGAGRPSARGHRAPPPRRSEEHTSELQSLMRISYAVFCLTKTKT